MPCTNKKKNEKQKEKIKKTHNLKNQIIGLTKETNKHFNYLLLFELKKPSRINATMHTFLMKIPIQILFLNENKQIQQIVYANKNQIIIPKKPCKYIIEAPIHKKFKLKQKINF